MKRWLAYWLLASGLVACYQREAFHPTVQQGAVAVRFELDWAARPQLPAGFYACFYPIESRPFVDFLDPYGGVLSIAPAHYAVLIFNNDTQKVRYRNTESFDRFEAYVPVVERASLVAGGPVEQGIAEPDRLFVASVRDFVVPLTPDTLYIKESPARLFAAYPFEVRGIVGGENLSAVRASVSGMAPWVRLSTGELGTPSATIFLNLRRTANGIEGGFVTFSHYDDPAVRHIFTLELLYQGRLITRTYDVTEMLHQTGRIELDESLDFPPVEGGGGGGGGGGFDPDLGGWEHDTVNIPINSIKIR